MKKLSLEEAKKVFQEANCSTFAMARENLPLFKRYLELEISNDIEIEWSKEQFYELLNTKNHYPNWEKVIKLSNLAQAIKQIECYHSIKNEIDTMLNSLSNLEQIIMAETIIGRRDNSVRGGLIYESYDLGDKSLAIKFAQMASNLLDFNDDDELIERVSNAKIKLSDVLNSL